jgi:F-type H+-transporting ATPase subunit b
MTSTPLLGGLLAAGGLTDINWVLSVAIVVVFALFALVLTRFGWGPLLHALEEREQGLREAVEGAHKASADAQQLLEKHKEMLREAGREREEIIKSAIAEADALKADLSARARTEADEMIRRAKEQVEREKSRAILELRAQVADLAMEAASKIVVSSLTPEAQKKLVDDYVKSLPEAVRHS